MGGRGFRMNESAGSRERQAPTGEETAGTVPGRTRGWRVATHPPDSVVVS
jgi:hypothetical protein